MSAISGPSAEAYAERRVLALMPTATLTVSIAKVQSDLEQLIKAPVSKMAPASVQEAQKHILGHVKKLDAGRPEPPRVNSAAFVTNAWSRFEHFLKVQDGLRVLSGGVAMVEMLRQCQAAWDKKKGGPRRGEALAHGAVQVAHLI